MHLFPGLFILRITIAAVQVLENQLDSMNRQSVCIIRCHDRNIRLDRMRQHVHTGVCRNALRHGQNKLRIDNGYIWRQLVIRQRILDISIFLIRNDGERSHFGTGTAGRRDRDHLGLLTQIGEMERSLADIHNFRRNPSKLVSGCS